MSVFLKTVARLVGDARALPAWVSYVCLKPVLGEAKALCWCAEAVSRVPGDVGVYARAGFYRRVLTGGGERLDAGGAMGVDVSIGFLSVLSKADVRMGDRVYLGRGVNVGLVDIGDDVRVADGCQLISGGHQHNGGDAEAVVYRRIRIGAGAWIGANAVVMADVGERAVVGAGAVVTRPVTAGVTVVGVPARPMRANVEPATREAA